MATIRQPSSRETGAANAQVAFKGDNDVQHGQAKSFGASRGDRSASIAETDPDPLVQESALGVWAENGKDGDQLSVASGAGDSSIASLATSHLLSPLHGGGG